MIKKITNGTRKTIQGLDCYIPPEGYVIDFQTGNLKKVGIYERSKSKQEQYWERIPLPPKYKEKRKEEKRIQEFNPAHIDNELDDYRAEAWQKRLEGMWFMNKGTPTYITGLHYYYLNWIFIGGNTRNNGYPDYWESDRDFFYFLQYVMEDDSCFGMIYVTRRREGKSSKSVAFLLEGVTRNAYANGGIQSKTEEDARNIVYRDGVLKSFRSLPDFFKPNYYEKGTSKGILFDDKKNNDDCLYGWIDFRSSTDTAYDGTKLHRYVGDEIFKTVNSNIYNRHEIILPTLEDVNRNPYGKCLYTSTVEEMEGHIDDYIRFWQDSNQKKRHPDTGFTRSKVFHYFQPAHKSMNRDIYGKCNASENERLIMAEREQVKNDARQYNGRVRKNPMTIEEAFRVTANNNIYDTVRLLDRHEHISWRDDLYEKGNFIWKDGVKDTEVVWEKSKLGRWKVRWDFIDRERLIRPLQTKPKPFNTHIFAIGCDPFSHSKAEDSYKASNGSFYVYKKRDVHDPDRSDCFVVEYCERPPTSQIFFEDLIKTCVFFGTDVLIENNRNNIMDYIKYRDYYRFAMHLPGRKDAGIATTSKTIGDIVDYTDSYIYTHLEKVYFPDLLKDWMNFDPNKTTSFDRAMAAGVTLIAANRYNLLEKKLGDKNFYDVKKLFG